MTVNRYSPWTDNFPMTSTDVNINGESNDEHQNGFINGRKTSIHDITDCGTIASYYPYPGSSEWTKFQVGGIVSRFPKAAELPQERVLLAKNEFMEIPIDISTYTWLTHLDLSNNRIQILPQSMGDLILLESLILKNNLIQAVPYSHCKMKSMVNYDLENNPLNSEMMKIYSGPENTLKFISNLAARFIPDDPPPPPERSYNIRRETAYLEIPFFDAMSFNVLFHRYATDTQYPYTVPWALSWNYRYGKIKQIIVQQSPHILALQEIGNDIYHENLAPDLKILGYDGILALKGRAVSVNQSSVDGCALFFKTEYFELIRSEVINFGQLATKFATSDAKMSYIRGMKENMLNRVMPYDNVAVVGILKPKVESFSSPDKPMKSMLPIVTCSAHLYWDPEYSDVKLIQTMILIKELTIIVESLAVEYKTSLNDIPILIMGDFNSLPESGVYQYLNQGAVEKRHPEFKNFMNLNLNEIAGADSDPIMYRHKLCVKNTIDPKHFPYTNYTSNFVGFIDYIFASPKALCNIGHLNFDHTWTKTNKIVGFPNEHIPSDHIPIATRLGMIDPNSTDVLFKGLMMRNINKSPTLNQ